MKNKYIVLIGLVVVMCSAAAFAGYVAPCDPVGAVEESYIEPCAPVSEYEQSAIAPCEPVRTYEQSEVIAPCAPIQESSDYVAPCAPVYSADDCQSCYGRQIDVYRARVSAPSFVRTARACGCRNCACNSCSCGVERTGVVYNVLGRVATATADLFGRRERVAQRSSFNRTVEFRRQVNFGD